jgi:hypothetical protein
LAARKAQRAGVDASLLQAALVGYEQMKREVEAKITSIRNSLGSGRATEVPASGRTMSASARKKIATAQKKRWALAKAKQVQPEPAQLKIAKPKRTMSAAGRRRIVAAQKKRWAAIKGKKKAA